MKFIRPRIYLSPTRIAAKIPNPEPNLRDTPLTNVLLADGSEFTMKHEPSPEIQKKVYSSIPIMQPYRVLHKIGAALKKDQNEEIRKMRHVTIRCKRDIIQFCDYHFVNCDK